MSDNTSHMSESAVDNKDLPSRDSVVVLFDYLPLQRATVLDLGCGNGWVAHALRTSAKYIIGLDPSTAQIDLAKADTAVNETFVCGLGEALPFGDAGFDIVLLFNSFHHIATGNRERALVECSRVMKKDGLLYVQEPVASGSAYELCRPLDDEAELYASAFDTIRDATDERRFVQVKQEWFNIDYRYDNFEAFCEEMICVKSDRGQRLDQLKASLETDFFRLGREESGGWIFDQVQRVDLLKKP